MSHKKHAEPPKVDHATDHTHDDIVCKSLTVRVPDGNTDASVAIRAFGAATGIWVNTGRGQECLGLIAPTGGAPYLIFYGQRASFPPPLAISGDGLQLPDEDGDINKAGDVAKTGGRATVIPFADLLAAIRHVIKRKSE